VREPYATLFAGYEDHWLLAGYLKGDEPDWRGMAADDRITMLSTGEKVFLDIACFFDGPVFVLDRANRVRIAQAFLSEVLR